MTREGAEISLDALAAAGWSVRVFPSGLVLERVFRAFDLGPVMTWSPDEAQYPAAARRLAEGLGIPKFAAGRLLQGQAIAAEDAATVTQWLDSDAGSGDAARGAQTPAPGGQGQAKPGAKAQSHTGEGKPASDA